ncbi:UNVERIFIED_ORG: hypothetical protein FHR35_007057 [Microbispora rosea subsp. rosea]
MDELWRVLRGAPGLVEYANVLTRLNPAKGMASVTVTRSLSDLDALTTEEDRAKARRFGDRSAITVLAGLPPRELARVSEVTPLTGPGGRAGRLLVGTDLLETGSQASWARQVPDQNGRAARHSGRAVSGR